MDEMRLRFLDIKMLSDYLKLSKSTIYKMVSSNSIPHIKLGKLTRFDIKQIDQWLLNGCRSVDLPDLPQL